MEATHVMKTKDIDCVKDIEATQHIEVMKVLCTAQTIDVIQ